MTLYSVDICRNKTVAIFLQLFYYINEMEINYIKRDIMEYKRLVDMALTEIRREIASKEVMDDGIAMEIIADTVFSLPASADVPMEELKNLIQKLFFKTRSKLGILTPLIEDKQVSEVMINGHDKIFFEREGRIERSSLSFDSEEELVELMQNIAAGVHREINELNPIVDARLADGSRVSGVYKNVAVSGPTLTVRKFSENYMKMEELTANGTLSESAAALLKIMVACGYNLFVSGGTSSGKTTLLNALSQFIEPDERVIVIEDSAELKLNYIDNLVQMECRSANSTGRGKVTMSQLIKSSLRMRPDRIIVGEVRGEEVVDMLQAMNTGHSGSMSTGHGNSTEGMLKRLETMYLMAIPIDINSVRAQIAEGIDIMIHVERFEEGRRITEISELEGYEGGCFKLNKLMTVDERKNMRFTGSYLRKDFKVRRKGERYVDELRNIGIIPKGEGNL